MQTNNFIITLKQKKRFCHKITPDDQTGVITEQKPWYNAQIRKTFSFCLSLNCGLLSLMQSKTVIIFFLKFYELHLRYYCCWWWWEEVTKIQQNRHLSQWPHTKCYKLIFLMKLFTAKAVWIKSFSDLLTLCINTDHWPLSKKCSCIFIYTKKKRKNALCCLSSFGQFGSNSNFQYAFCQFDAYHVHESLNEKYSAFFFAGKHNLQNVKIIKAFQAVKRLRGKLRQQECA